MEEVKESMVVQLRKLWALYLRRLQVCKQLEKQSLAEDKSTFIKHFQAETQLFLNEASQFDWILGQKCLPIAVACKSLYEVDNHLINVYTVLQNDTSWEQEYPELSRFLMRNLGRIKASLGLTRYL